ncbi:MAG: DUF2924 domain-containing protein [Lentisphaerae bacterium]|nr:DUF2924 domain-containing protein [Lentisphaerota bacterium]
MDKKEILERKLSQLEDLTWEEQKEMFFELFGFDCGLSNGKNIKKRLFNKLQEIYLGGVSESDQLILRRIAENDDRANLRQVGKNRNMTQGTRLVKEWKGKIYTVTITVDGRYEYDGEIYRSLSAVADKITGTHWNGKKFFGVK